MKQLARTAVYWPGIDRSIVRSCTACAEHQNRPAVHPWMVPEKPWSCLHADHAINFMGSNWLVLIDAYSKYPCIHSVTSTSTKSTVELLEADFAHNATTFTSREWCKSRGIVHLTGAPYHPATNGAAERLVQTFKQALRKSFLPPKEALQQFLMQYRRTPLSSGELLNGRQLRAAIDTLTTLPAHQAQQRQNEESLKMLSKSSTSPRNHQFTVGMSCYALYFGPKRDKEPRWVLAVVTKVYGSRSVNVKVYP